MKKNIQIKYTKSVKEAMQLLNRTGQNCLIVINDNKTMLGTLTDGDIRRYILINKNLNHKIKNIFNNKPKYVNKIGPNFNNVKKLMLKYKIDLVPVVDRNFLLLDYCTWEQVFKSKQTKKSFKRAPSVVIMAGGKGKRMKPFTNVLPKPLLPLGEKTIIEKIIDSFSSFGIKTYFLSINDKSQIIKSFFKELSGNHKVKFIEEKKPLGTAGSLKLVTNKITDTFFLTNCDTLTKANYFELMEFHKKGKFAMTLVASSKKFSIPYGVCELSSEGELNKIKEKIKNNYLVNVGLYVLNSNILKYIPSNEFYDMTDFIKDLKKDGKKIGVYPIHQNEWTDVGQWDEYKKALEKI